MCSFCLPDIRGLALAGTTLAKERKGEVKSKIFLLEFNAQSFVQVHFCSESCGGDKGTNKNTNSYRTLTCSKYKVFTLSFFSPDILWCGPVLQSALQYKFLITSLSHSPPIAHIGVIEDLWHSTMMEPKVLLGTVRAAILFCGLAWRTPVSALEAVCLTPAQAEETCDLSRATLALDIHVSLRMFYISLAHNPLASVMETIVSSERRATWAWRGGSLIITIKSSLVCVTCSKLWIVKCKV